MKVTLLLVGKTSDPAYLAIINQYVQRVNHYINFNIDVIIPPRNVKGLSVQVQKEKEHELIMKSLVPEDTVILLDEHGSEMRSTEFAAFLQKTMNSTGKRIVFVVGGPYGFDERILEKGFKRVSLSRMTLSHQMVRLFFMEQLYRALTILKGEPYHHE